MKKHLYLIFFTSLMTMVTVQAQLSILFVEDTEDLFGNAEALRANLDALSISYDLYNAFEQMQSPTAVQMNNYDLVIWYSGSELEGLYFWNDQDADNDELKAYLEGGGYLWLIGTDVLYDRYADAPDDFQEGDFVYDYLGLTRYQLQTFADDGGVGLPFATPDAASSVMGLDSLTWQFPTLYYVDGVLPRPEAQAVYRMDAGGYVFRDSICGVWNSDPPGGVLSFYFDLALVETNALLQETLDAVIDFFTVVVGTEDPLLSEYQVQAFPNPVREHMRLRLDLPRAEQVGVEVYSIVGKKVADLLPVTQLPAGPQEFLWSPGKLPAGSYVCRLTIGGRQGSFLLQIQ